MPRADEAAHNFVRRPIQRIGIERVAAEQVNLLELREEPRTGVAARDTLHFGDRKRLARVYPVGVELVAAVEMTGDQQYVAANALAARRRQPVGPSPFHELDELVAIRRQAAPERFLFIRGIDGDRADGRLVR